MACEIVSSPFPEHAPNGDWLKTESNNELDAFIDFNAASFGGNNGSTVDPQMLSNPSSPEPSFGAQFDVGGSGTTPSLGAAYPVDFANVQASYYQSIEHPHSQHGSPPAFAPSSLRHEFRRSVSEPPGGLPMHHRHVQSAPEMTFHRNGHFLGNTQRPGGVQRLKSLPKGKQHARSQPYSKNKGNAQYVHQQQSPRYHLRRANTQPVRHHAPTSMPPPPPQSPMHHPYPPALGHHVTPGHPSHVVFEPLPGVSEQRSYISSRVCTPTPEEMQGPMMGSPQQVIDPLLTAPPTSAAIGLGISGGRQTGLTLPLTVEELKRMIEEAVQNAVRELEAGSKDGSVVTTTELGGSSEQAGMDSMPAEVEDGASGEADQREEDIKQEEDAGEEVDTRTGFEDVFGPWLVRAMPD